MIKQLTIKNLHDILAYEHNNYSAKQIKNMLINPNYYNIGCFVKKELVAYLFTSVSEHIDIIWIFTIPPFRQQGYASQLVKILRNTYPNPIIIEVNKNNTGAIIFYNKLGFKIIHSRLKYYQNLEDAIVMELTK